MPATRTPPALEATVGGPLKTTEAAPPDLRMK